jgi:hypothetical protein
MTSKDYWIARPLNESDYHRRWVRSATQGIRPCTTKDPDGFDADGFNGWGLQKSTFSAGQTVNASGYDRQGWHHIHRAIMDKKEIEKWSKDHDELISLNALGFRPLHLAILQGDETCIDYLLNERKVSITATTRDGRNPLHLAVQAANKTLATRLMKANASLRNDRDKAGKQPIDYVFRTDPDRQAWIALLKV